MAEQRPPSVEERAQRASRDRASAREEILARVREAVAGVEGEPEPITAPAGVALDGDQRLSRFVERVEDYRASVSRCSSEDLVATVLASVPEGASVVVPGDLGIDLPDVIVDDGHTALDLDQIAAVVTRARLGIAETGTIVLDHAPDQGRRMISLVPDLHVCVVRAAQVVADVPDAVAALDPSRPQTWISGPSATSDIELDRVEGVHGPRTLVVVLVDG